MRDLMDHCLKKLGKSTLTFQLFANPTSLNSEKVLKNFKGTSSCRILIASLRSAGVGLNLTVASYVFLLDPWWNESVENQAIDRVHRLGQTRPVHIKRFIMQGSIEENMLDIQRRKSALAGAISSDSKVTLDDLVRLFEF